MASLALLADLGHTQAEAAEEHLHGGANGAGGIRNVGFGAQAQHEGWSAGAIAPVVGATYPLEEAADALRLVAERRSTGKVVLVP